MREGFIDGQLHREQLGWTQNVSELDGFHPLGGDSPAGDAAECEHDPVDLHGSRHERELVVVAVKVCEIAGYDKLAHQHASRVRKVADASRARKESRTGTALFIEK